jgi:FkbM family methyltransferase
MTFVDVGANVGYYSFMVASLVGNNGKVLAFEPSLYAYEKLQSTIRKNQIVTIEAIQAGLSDISGDLQLFIPRKDGNHSPSMVANQGGDPISVPVYQLDEYLTMNRIDHVNLIKIDVEGFEPNVIRGAQNYIKNKKIGAILVEFNHYWLTENGSSPSDLYTEIIEFGFRPQIPLDLNRDLQNIFFTID